MMPPEIATATGASTKNLAPKHGLETVDLRENKSETEVNKINKICLTCQPKTFEVNKSESPNRWTCNFQIHDSAT